MTREEAIKVVKKNWPDSRYTSLREALETLIPGLKESEDERIREGLIHHLKELREWQVGSMSPIKTKEHYDAWIAYLEKQKELKTPEEKIKHPLYVEGFEAGKQVGAQYESVFGEQKERGPLTKEEEYTLHRIIEYLEDETCPSEWISLLHDIYCLPYEKQKEQKSIPSREMILGIWELGNFWKENPEARDGLTQLQYIQKHWDENCGHQKEQKPRKFKLGDKVHWHDDDKNVITITGFRDDAYLTDSAYGPILFGDENNWEIIKQKPWKVGANAYFTPEQKPAEWSEEDEKMLNNLIWAVHMKSISPCDEMDDRNVYKKYEKFLKSLRPSWKPSEEQMDRLFSIIAALRKDYCDDMADFLANLRADLKKLGVKEEPEYYQHFDPDC